MQLVQIHDLGRVSYKSAWDYQTYVHQKLLHKKLKFKGKANINQLHHLILCEHNHVYTLGKSGKPDHLLLDKNQLDEKGIEYYKINRGGDITYHGLGQLTVYPIFDLELFYRDVHLYVRSLEQVVINTLKELGLKGDRIKEFTGVWLDVESRNARKICAIGVHLSRWVSLHGLALNVNTELDYFKNIIPCGIDADDKTVTSIKREIREDIELSKVKAILLKEFANVFELEFIKI